MIDESGSLRSTRSAFQDEKMYQSMRFSYKGSDLGEFISLLFGKKNALNVACAVLFLLELGFDAEKVKKALINFSGAQRRFELVAHIGNNVLLRWPYSIRASARCKLQAFFGNGRVRVLLFHRSHNTDQGANPAPPFFC